MEKVIIDTDLYIDWINGGGHEDFLIQRPFLRYMSAVVLMELRAGASRQADRALVQRLYDTFARTGRLLNPSPSVFWEAGRVLLLLQRSFHYELKKRFPIINDVLIALTCREIGATLISRNVKDFKTIQRLVPFRLIAIE
ncbi:MAG: type II toxin-antitoxin system VapC family toxin [Deltaproteobacteria bacterium]|nr:type II toxin-antitoxin system VapC family toxin [Deltaproteobacteria bacterium]